jgi:hypothetical protein
MKIQIKRCLLIGSIIVCDLLAYLYTPSLIMTPAAKPMNLLQLSWMGYVALSYFALFVDMESLTHA